MIVFWLLEMLICELLFVVFFCPTLWMFLRCGATVTFFSFESVGYCIFHMIGFVKVVFSFKNHSGKKMPL